MDVPELNSSQLVIDGCRRLTGPSLVWDETGGILDILVDGLDLDQVLACWNRHIDSVLTEVGWSDPRLAHRRFENGFNLLLAAPRDQLYSAVLALETAWYFCSCELLAQPVESREALLDELRAQMQREKNPRLIDLESAAAQHGVDFLADDDSVSVGHGSGSQTFPVDELPAADDVDWSSVHDLPVALITGTNGKSTSVRLLSGIAAAAGQVSGVTSTDFVRVGNEVLDRGDYSGPGGARLLLRDKRLQAAFLEVARGGILRRGLPLRRARAALVTNIAGDHLGQYGVNTLAALTQTKFAVARTLTEDGILVTNADDAEIVKFLEDGASYRLCWFSLDKSNRLIERQIERRQPCCFADQGQICYFDGEDVTTICAIDDIPMTLNGAALHNVRNALGAVGIAMAMGYAVEHIRSGLQQFHSDIGDNPGRMNHFLLANEARVIVDFAHNEHSVSAIATTVRRMAAANKWVLFGSAGDRSDEHMAAIAQAVCSIEPRHIVITELEHYLRGRKLGEVSQIMKKACLQSGIDEDCIHLAETPLAGVKFALQRMAKDDLGLFLVLSERDQVIDYLKSQQASDS